MNIKKIVSIIVILVLIILIVPNYFSEQQNTINSISGVEKMEIYHFHVEQQCYSCITVGKYAEETVNTYFQNELKSGKIVFAHVNIDLSENYELVNRYGATGSSLWIGVYDEGGNFVPEENSNVWYKINNRNEYVEYLKSVIEEKL